MKTIVESIIGRRGSNKKLYIVSPKGSDSRLYWDNKFTYNAVTDSRGYFYFVLTKNELQKFLPQEPDTSIYLVDDDTVDYKKLEQDVKKTKDLLNNPLIYLKKVDVMSIGESIIGRKGIEIWPNPYHLTKKDAIGNIKNWPLEIITLALKEMELQHSERDLTYLQKNGPFFCFAWKPTKDGHFFLACYK